jgi:hypothetical protein
MAATVPIPLRLLLLLLLLPLRCHGHRRRRRSLLLHSVHAASTSSAMSLRIINQSVGASEHRKGGCRQ